MTLEELVLRNYDIIEYYEKHLLDVEVYDNAVNKKVKKYSQGFNTKEMAVCPLHNDHDPSFGLMNSRQYKGVRVGHCFGCNSVVDVIRLHQLLSNKGIFGTVQDLSYEDAARELAQEKGLNTENLSVSQVDYNNMDIQKALSIRKAMNRYTIRDYQNDMLRIRVSGNNTKNKVTLMNRKLVQLITSLNPEE